MCHISKTLAYFVEYKSDLMQVTKKNMIAELKKRMEALNFDPEIESYMHKLLNPKFK